MKKLLLLFLIVFSGQLFAQETKISGTVTSDDNSKVLSGASITIKDKVLGTTTNAAGNFSLNYKGKLPITLIISALGYETKEIEVNSLAQNIFLTLNTKSIMLNEVVSSASRVSQSILQSPVSIEKMSLKAI